MLSVIIPAHNAGNYIDGLLEALSTQQIPQDGYEIIVVNDGSIDDTLLKLEKWKERLPNMRVFSIPHSGPSVARNRGAEEAKGEILVFIDADCIPPSYWLKRIREEFEKSPSASVVYGSVTANIHGKLLPFFVTFEIKGEVISPANMAIKKEIFKRLDGFDGYFKNFAEDWELWFRVKKAGLNIRYCEDIKVYHPPKPQKIERIVEKIKKGIREWGFHIKLRKKHREFKIWELIKEPLYKAGVECGVITFSFLLVPSYTKVLLPLIIFWSYGMYRVVRVKWALKRNRLNLKIKKKDMLNHILFSWLNPFISLLSLTVAYIREVKGYENEKSR